MANSTTAIAIGGYTGHGDLRNESWFYNFDNEEQGWVQGPSLEVARAGHACGTLKDSENDGKTVVIAAGGHDKSSAEILDVTSKHPVWLKGPDLPSNISYAAGSCPCQLRSVQCLAVGHTATDKL